MTKKNEAVGNFNWFGQKLPASSRSWLLQVRIFRESETEGRGGIWYLSRFVWSHTSGCHSYSR